jgi:hypothetical protein
MESCEAVQSPGPWLPGKCSRGPGDGGFGQLSCEGTVRWGPNQGWRWRGRRGHLGGCEIIVQKIQKVGSKTSWSHKRRLWPPGCGLGEPEGRPQHPVGPGPPLGQCPVRPQIAPWPQRPGPLEPSRHRRSRGQWAEQDPSRVRDPGGGTVNCDQAGGGVGSERAEPEGA